MLTLIAPRRPEGCPSDLVFDEWHAGELDRVAREAVETHVSGCAPCRARTAEVAAEASRFLSRFPALSLPAGAPPHPSRRRPRHLVPASLAFLAAAAGLLLFLRSPGAPKSVRSKGGPHLGFFVKRGARVFPGADGETVYPGDRLRFVVSTGTATHVAIFSLDAKGIASVYEPAGPETRLVGPARELPLDGSVELDGTVGTERIFGLFCDAPVAVEKARAGLERTHTVAVPPGCFADGLRLEKEPSP
jgi:hypothetical protein